ncbi:McrB family protein [Lactobacillus delbrueckii subsp. bulgaricus]|nr:hypothetical protein [Lactobacillus delbrueckii subsp. bulgaricus]MBT8935204.1 hypothetical protein [Lactobacillus delbrueckii subsp. bulgaricus]
MEPTLFYISKDDISKSITYFKKRNCEIDDSLSFFLMFKHLGISTEHAIEVDAKSEAFCKAFDDIAKITDPKENYKYLSYITPSTFPKEDPFYQKKTESKKIYGRIRDTIKQKNNKVKLYNFDLDSNALSLTTRYQDTLSSNYLSAKDNDTDTSPISLTALACWLFRFHGFEFTEEPSKQTFTRVIRKLIFKYFHINKQETLWLFNDDLYQKFITPTTTQVTGKDIRGYLGVDIGSAEHNSIKDAKWPNYSSNITKQYAELTGDNPSISTIIKTLLAKKQIILTGVPGIGKSYYTKLISDNEEFKKIKGFEGFEDSVTVQFHANYSYEEFIGGTRLKNSSDNSQMIAVQKEGVLLQIVSKALTNPDKNYLLVIDEINRGNIAAILGETILTLDRNYSVNLAEPINNVTQLQLPDNLYIIGTMNTSDRNIAFLDLAIRRRFAFIELHPNYEYLAESIRLLVKTRGTDYSFNLGGILNTINNRIYDELKDSEKFIGQSYFIPNTGSNSWEKSDFQNQFNFVLIPTLKEYEFQKSGITEAVIGDKLSDTILDIDDFYTAFAEQFAELTL